MKVWLVGGGGREHALAWKLAQSPLVDRLWIAPGNPGTSSLGVNMAVPAGDAAAQADAARSAGADFVVVGPEAPLAAGLADRLAMYGIPCFGPVAAAARIESSKAFAKRVMAEAGVPTAASAEFTESEPAKRYAAVRGGRVAVKADGLAGGKGVIVCASVAESDAAIDRLLEGGRLVVEEVLQGPEVSIIALCDGVRALPLAAARDHKRLQDGERGPNTGGMGAVSPVPGVPGGEAALLEWTRARVLEPTLAALAARGTPFRGALYAGLMLTKDGPKVLEFNARFGDPETEPILARLSGDLVPALVAAASGSLAGHSLSWRPDAAVCVVLAALGYPDAPRHGDVVSGVDAAKRRGALVFHAGTAQRGGRLVTSGGRVLAVTSLGVNVAEARANAYAACAELHFDGMQLRRDIAS